MSDATERARTLLFKTELLPGCIETTDPRVIKAALEELHFYLVASLDHIDALEERIDQMLLHPQSYSLKESWLKAKHQFEETIK